MSKEEIEFQNACLAYGLVVNQITTLYSDREEELNRRLSEVRGQVTRIENLATHLEVRG